MPRRANPAIVGLLVGVLVTGGMMGGCGGGGGGGPSTIVRSPSDATGLRSSNGGVTVLLLTFMAVKSGTEDRTILHYDISGLPSTFTSARLDLPISNLDPGPPDGILEVYHFAGDGTVSTNEWASGTLLQTILGIGGGTQVLSVDVTTQLQAAVTVAQPYLSFNLRAGLGTDRYWLGATGGLPDPMLTITP